MEINLEKVIENVRVVDEKRNYWFIRTFRGQLFQPFLDGSYVGIGLNKVPLSYIKDARYGDKVAMKTLKTFIEKNENYKKGAATNIGNQLIDFDFNINIGDIVLIPDKDSNNFAIGIVESDIYIVENPGTFDNIVQGKENAKEPLPQKRRKINWLKIVNREFFRGGLIGLLTSQQPLTNAKEFKDKIEGSISELYIRGDKAYLTLLINQDEEINAFELNKFLTSITYFYKFYCKENNFEINEELYIKIKLQSKGNAIFKGLCISALVSIALLLVLSDNTSVNLFMGNTGVKGHSDGLIKSLDEHKKRKSEIEHQEKENSLKYSIDSAEAQLHLAQLKDSMTKLKTDTTRLKSELVENPPKI